MKINDIFFLNIDDLYSIICEKEDDENYKTKMFERNLSQLYNHIEITYDLSEVSLFDYMVLKYYASSVTRINITGFNKELTEKTFPEIFGSCLEQYIDMIDVEGDNSKYSKLGLVYGSCTAKFTGTQLASIITLNPMNFFITASDRKCVIEVDNTPTLNKDYKYEIYKDETFKNNCIYSFIKGFYKYMIDKIEYIDLASDSFVYEKFLSKVSSDKKEVKILTVRNHSFDVNMIDDDIQYIMDTFNNYKEINYFPQKIMNDTVIEFCLNTELFTFINLLSILPIDKFTSVSHLNIPLNRSLELSRESDDSPKAESFYKYLELINKKATDVYDIKNSSDKIKLCQLITSNIYYKYNISITLSDVNRYLIPYLNYANEIKRNVIENSDSIETINLIKELCRSIYSYLQK